ncbi:substrate-binding domain-containing protein [Actinomycetospora soli]|uniref:substrate-binding domain-containing protein n=1 Tax=Actinomycetospora soli TaxID=2893887 RepID=UPI001E442B0B|nr:substrate-binding domain-containing protein [Actinomycetospora soli]MCD2188986.1 substrate-binding domain-containing protein [Actinomycetospora soli]
MLAVAAAAAVALTFTACSSQGGAQNQNQATSQRFTIAMITHEQPGDSFWDKIRAGAQQAASELNVDLRYSNNNDGGQQATLVQNAIDSRVNGIAVTLSYPDQVGPVAQKAVQAGIPVVGFNQGIDQYQQFGMKMYFGSDETLAGQSAGQRLGQLNPGGKALCVIQEQGSVALETRCAGVKQAYANTENLQVNGADLPSVQQTIQAKLQQDPAITDVVTLGAPVALAAMQAKQASSSQAQIVTFDLNADVAKAIQSNQIAFSVDQQPYVQGYMAVQALWLQLSNGNDLGGGKPVLTGPSFVDASNIGPIVQYAEKNTR